MTTAATEAAAGSAFATAADPPLLHVENLRVSFGDAEVVKGISFTARAIRGREIGFILQDALVSLDQLRLVGDEITEPLRLHGWGTRATRRERAIELLGSVGVPEPEVKVRQRPYELSGGLRQRALIASAIALDPKLLIADEPTTALDVTIQAQVLDLLAEYTRALLDAIPSEHTRGVRLVRPAGNESAVRRTRRPADRGTPCSKPGT